MSVTMRGALAADLDGDCPPAVATKVIRKRIGGGFAYVTVAASQQQR